MSSLGDVFYLLCTKCVYLAVLQHAAICVQCIVVVRSVHCASLAFVFKLAFALNVFLAIPELPVDILHGESFTSELG